MSTEDEITFAALEEECFGGPMPSWAIGHSGGEWVVGAQLATRDGRITGNAHILAVHLHELHPGYDELMYTCITDAGNYIHRTLGEMKSGFYEPTWVSNTEDIIKRFGREEDK